MPCGTKQPTKRGFGAADVWASSVAGNHRVEQWESERGSRATKNRSP